MKPFLLSALAVVALFFAGRWVVHALALDETKIRWRLESMAEGFNETRTNACLAGLAPEFVDDTYGADRELVHQGLVRLFFEKKDEQTRGFLYRVQLPLLSMKIDVQQPGAEHAHVELLARFFEKHGETEQLVWETKIEAQMVQRDGEWLVLRTEHTTISGKLLK